MMVIMMAMPATWSLMTGTEATSTTTAMLTTVQPQPQRRRHPAAAARGQRLVLVLAQVHGVASSLRGSVLAMLMRMRAILMHLLQALQTLLSKLLLKRRRRRLQTWLPSRQTRGRTSAPRQRRRASHWTSRTVAWAELAPVLRCDAPAAAAAALVEPLPLLRDSAPLPSRQQQPNLSPLPPPPLAQVRAQAQPRLTHRLRRSSRRSRDACRAVLATCASSGSDGLMPWRWRCVQQAAGATHRRRTITAALKAAETALLLLQAM